MRRLNVVMWVVFVVGVVVQLLRPGIALGNNIWADDCDWMVTGQSVFVDSESVCVSGDLDYSCGGFFAEANIYIVANGDPSPLNGVIAPVFLSSTMAAGAFISEPVWLPPLAFGTYDLVIDERCDGVFNPTEDVRTVAAFNVIGCGDGLVNLAEQCDDAGESATCDTDCTDAICGDGVVNGAAGETCEEGSETATCDSDCTDAVCGDGYLNVTAGEACDDGGESATCDADCTVAACGDATANATAGEDCDDGGESASCDADCTVAACGDSTLNVTAGETCDEGAATASCDADCTEVLCGDSTLNTTAGEQCDDGNSDDSDGCSALCVVEPGWVCDGNPGQPCRPITCGDGLVDVAEECDDAGESASCDVDCTLSQCGDGVLNSTAGEACDDANTAGGDGCSSGCALELGDAGLPDGGSPQADAGATDADAGEPPDSNDGGCNCRAAGSEGLDLPWLAIGLLLLLLFIARPGAAGRGE